MIITNEEMQRLGEVLSLCRQCRGWSTEEFASQIGVTRQTVNNLESGRGKLSKTQYMAIRCLFDDEMELHPEETAMLKTLLDACVDHPENYDDEKRREIIDSIALLAPGVSKEPKKRMDAAKTWKAVCIGLGILFPVSTLTALAINTWKKHEDAAKKESEEKQENSDKSEEGGN